MDVGEKINLAIAIGTAIAAAGSFAAAFIASRSARQSEKLSEKSVNEENNRWLTGLLYSLANQCNECVSKSGKVLPTEENLSRIVTILSNAIELINRESNPSDKTKHLSNLWIFLHSSIWIEIEQRAIFSGLNITSPKTVSVLSSQYEKVRCELMNKVK